MLNIAEGAVRELSSILMRQRELATQAANGTVSKTQREALELEANKLREEYNRIANTTTFNGQSLLVAGQGARGIQGGYGTNGSIAVNLTTALARNVGDGTFQSGITSTTPFSPFNLSSEDLNGDGLADLVALDDVQIRTMLGNGNGTFRMSTTYSFGLTQQLVDSELGDLNGDGIYDVAVADYAVGAVQFMLGNGNGTFKAAYSYDSGGATSSIRLWDVNNDDVLDLVASNFTDNTVSIYLGNGDGSFIRRLTISTITTARTIRADDYNRDGKDDLLISENNGLLQVYLGNGNGTFKAGVSYSGGQGVLYGVDIGDVNGDGLTDVVSTDYDNDYGSILIGNGDGSFKARVTFVTGVDPDGLTLIDLDQDGDLDLVTGDQGGPTISVHPGNGNGTFLARRSYAATSASWAFAFKDFTGDGAIDIAEINGAGGGSIGVLAANTRKLTDIAPLSFDTRLRARESMLEIDAALLRVVGEIGQIGAAQSRLSTAVSNLFYGTESYTEAQSRITDVDVAEEAARLTKNKILQQAGASVLAQANQLPALALTLLSSV